MRCSSTFPSGRRGGTAGSQRTRGLVVLLVTALSVLLSASPVAAHGSLVATDPANGASQEEPPGEIRLWFDEPIRLGFSAFELRSLDGRLIAIQGVREPGQGGALVLAPPPLERGG